MGKKEKKKSRSMIIEKCAHIDENGGICNQRGLLMEDSRNLKYYVVRHSISYYEDGRLNGNGYPKKFRRFIFHRVPSDWAKQILDDEDSKSNILPN